MSDFLAMGGYAFFVWGSYAAGLLVLAWNVAAPLRARRELLGQLRADRP